MGKRVRISNDRLNSYGTRVLTDGMDVEQYRRNPVLLYMHERGKVIGLVKDLKVEDGEVTGELVFDEATELSQRCKKQWEFGSLKMVSVGIDILETSEEPALLLQGQTRPTISKSKLYEVSLVDVGANDDAIVLKKDGQQITLGKDGLCLLPEISNNPKTTSEMDTKTIALQLGLPETATEAEISAKIGELNAAKQQNETLQLAHITAMVDKAIGEKRLAADKKNHFVELGKKIGAEELSNVLAAMSPQVKLSAIIGHQGGVPSDGPKAFTKLSDVPADMLLKMREEQPEEYKRLYKVEYGMECQL